jgi:hypothetical protein
MSPASRCPVCRSGSLISRVETYRACVDAVQVVLTDALVRACDSCSARLFQREVVQGAKAMAAAARARGSRFVAGQFIAPAEPAVM